MYSNAILTRQWSRLSCLCRYSSAIESQRLPESVISSDGITPPPRIPRSPTDILQALSATVGPDPTAAHYKYHDDPYLTPLSNYRKRAYALSAEAGRKAAAWIRDEHAEWFTTREWDPPGKMKTPYYNADPQIPAFSPRPIYNDESKVTEQDLELTIKNGLVEDSIKVFQLLGGINNVSDKLKLSFLEMLCFYNEKEADSMEWLEEKWFATSSKERHATTWRLGGLAEQIFTSIEPKTSEVYCAVIQGMAKYYQAERAHALSNEAIENGITLSTPVYNSLLSCIGFLKEGIALRTEALLDTLRRMNDQGLTPNGETLTACLRSISAWGGGLLLQKLAMQIVAEFKSLGIEPSLSAYYYLLCLFCKERGPRVDILSIILNDLESRPSLQISEQMDTNFFITAMSVCSDHLQDIALAERVHTLLMKDNNYRLCGDAYKESIYYRHYVTVACRHAPFERTIQLLDELVPNVYVPEPSVMEEIINTLEVAGSGDKLTQAWNQLVVFGLAKRIKLVEKLLGAICSCYKFQDENVQEKMRKTAAEILQYGEMIEEREQTTDQRSPPKRLSASALCNIIELCADSEPAQNAATDSSQWESVAKAVRRLGEATGVPAKPAVLADVAVKAAKHSPNVAGNIVSYLTECGFSEASPAIVRVLSEMLNRPEEDVETVLQQPIRELSGILHPAALAVVEAYKLISVVSKDSKSEEPWSRSRMDSSSDSDDSGSSDDDD